MRDFGRGRGGSDRGRGGSRGGDKFFGSGGRNFSDRRSFGGDDRGDRQMYSAVCANCGKECQVPFRPSGDKPVYCRDCFEKLGLAKTSDNRSFSRPRSDDRRGGGDGNSAQLEALNAKLDKIIKLLQPKREKKEDSSSAEAFVAPPEATPTEE